jgi:hypothetical protein
MLVKQEFQDTFQNSLESCLRRQIHRDLGLADI